MSVTVKSSSRRPGAGQRGFTLIELMVGFTIAVLLTLAAVSFAAHETRLMGISRERLDLAQASRAAIDLLAEDIKQAGAGIGYQADGVFPGLRLDDFVVDSIQFNPDGGPPTPFDPGLSTPPGVRAEMTIGEVGRNEATPAIYTSITTDIGIMTANGSYATIVDYNPAGTGTFCTHPETNFRPNERVVFRSQSSLDAFTAAISTVSTGPCSLDNGHSCARQCTTFTFVPKTIFSTEPVANGYSYLGGEIGGKLKTIVWFMVSDGVRGGLRRAVFDESNTCTNRDASCGNNVVDNVEAFVAQAWTFDRATGTWINAGQTPINSDNRIRVDVELVLRSRKSAARPTFPVPLNLLPGPNNCIPSGAGSCNQPRDYGQRTVIRTSVEVKNSGGMALQ